MKKYIRAIICLLFSLFKFWCIKLFHLKNFKFTIYNVASPFTEVEIGRKAILYLGRMVRIRSGTKIRVRQGAEVHIGSNTSFNHGCMVICHEKIVIGNDVQFGPNTLVYDHDHDFRKENGLKELKYKTSPVEIGNNVWIGANTVILRGTRIGDNCVIGAGAVVKGVFPDNSIIIQDRQTKVIPISSDTE